MRKRFTKIICAALAVISVATVALLPGCKKGWSGMSGEKDSDTEALAGTNGGFVVETTDYAYFINGKAESTDSNTFGEVLNGSVQRIKKSDLQAGNYSSTQTVVPSVIYAGSYDAGLYIYGGYIYYTTPSTQKNSDGEVLNSRLNFKRTKLDGTGTTDGYIWQSTDNTVDYRYVQGADGTVYILYAIEEDDKTNIHSVNCNTGKNTLLAYDVSAYAFDSEDPENPYVYYTMSVPVSMGESDTYDYNQLYRVCADVTESPREYNYDDVDDYDASSNPTYVNYGDFVLDGIGISRAADGLTQFNYGYDATKTDQTLTLDNGDYTYEIQWYKNGELFYTRTAGDTDSTHLYKITDADVDADSDGKIDSDWNAIEKNDEKPVFISSDYDTEYTYITMDGIDYALELGSDGIIRRTVTKTTDGYEFGKEVLLSSSTSATLLTIEQQNGHYYMYYSLTGGNGYYVYRLDIGGDDEKYTKLPATEDGVDEYNGVQILNIDACSDWYMPEFVGNVLMFASETEGMSDYNYIMACDLTSSEGSAIMDNSEIKELNERYDAVIDKIEAYDDVMNPDGETQTYENLEGALKYQFYTRDSEYLGELIQAYVDVEGRATDYLYSEESVAINADFAAHTNDWATDDDGNAYLTRTINGETIYSNTADYYYTVVGRMTDADAEGYIGYFRSDSSYMQTYPVDTSTWWDKLSTGGKVGFIIGMVAAGFVAVACIYTACIAVAIHVKKRREQGGRKGKMRVDITDDKNIDVYGGEEQRE